MASRMTLEFEVKKQSIFRKDIFKPTENSQNYLYAHFNFDEDWQGLDKKVAIFSYNKKDYMVDINNETDTCEIIEDVIKASGFKVGVKGYLKNKQVIITSEPIFVSVKSTFDIADDVLEPIRQILSSTLDIKKYQYTSSIEIPNIYATRIGYSEDGKKLLLFGRNKDDGEDLILSEVELDGTSLDEVESGYYDNEKKVLVFTLKDTIDNNEDNETDNGEETEENEGIGTLNDDEEEPPLENEDDEPKVEKRTIEIPFEFNIQGDFNVDLSNYYTINEIDDKLNLKANTSELQSLKDKTSNALNEKVSLESFDNFKDQNGKDLSSKVDKVDGKGLSTNDYTNEDKAKLDKIKFDSTGKISKDILPTISTNPSDNIVSGEKGEDGVGISNIYSGNTTLSEDGQYSITTIGVLKTDGNRNYFDVKVKNGDNGVNGTNGLDGIGILTIENEGIGQTDSGYTSTTLRVKYTDTNKEDTLITVYVKNGVDGTSTEVGEQIDFNPDNYYDKNYIDTEMDSINVQLETINGDITSINEKIAQIESTLSPEASDVSLLNDGIVSINESYEDKTQTNTIDVEELKNKVSQLETKLSGLSNSVEDFDKSILVGVVGTFKNLSNYDKSNLKVGDYVQVLIDEKYSNASTVYKWNGSYFSYVGKFADTYSKKELDTMFEKVGKDISSISEKVNELSTKLETINVNNQNEVHTHYINIFFNKEVHNIDDEELQLSLDIVSNDKSEEYTKEELFSYLENASENIIKANGFYKTNNSFSIVLFICEVNVQENIMIVETATMQGTNTLTFNLSDLGIFDKTI